MTAGSKPFSHGPGKCARRSRRPCAYPPWLAAGGLSGKAAEIGATGALLYILMHGLAKGGLFLCAGIVEQRG